MGAYVCAPSVELARADPNMYPAPVAHRGQIMWMHFNDNEIL